MKCNENISIAEENLENYWFIWTKIRLEKFATCLKFKSMDIPKYDWKCWKNWNWFETWWNTNYSLRAKNKHLKDVSFDISNEVGTVYSLFSSNACQLKYLIPFS